jgi:hypothetical protein
MFIQRSGKRRKDLIGCLFGHPAVDLEDQKTVFAVLDNPQAGAFGGRHARQIAGPAFGFRHLGRGEGAEFDHRQSIDLSPAQNLLQSIVDPITGPLGVVISPLALISVFLSWLFGILDFRQALWVLVAIADIANCVRDLRPVIENRPPDVSDEAKV